MYRREDFRSWMTGRGYKPNTVYAHVSTLNRVDKDFDIDAKLEGLGIDGLLKWAKEETSGLFEKYPSDARSALNRYVEFTIADQSPDEEETLDPASAAPILFELEREMQAAVRRQLENLEAGLKIDDGGVETSVATGRTDIVARDKAGKLVVIELKAGPCPSGAIEQVLGYAEALSQEKTEDVRAYLIAGQFSARTLAAAKRVNGLQLRTYDFVVRFNPVSESKGQ